MQLGRQCGVLAYRLGRFRPVAVLGPPLRVVHRRRCSSVAAHAVPPDGASSSGNGVPNPSGHSGHRPAPSSAALKTVDELNSAPGSPDVHPWHERFDVKEDRVIYKRYVTVYDRAVEFTSDDGQPHTLHYDVVGHPQSHHQFSCSFPFHPATATTPAQVTVVHEYAQGPNALMYSLPCGGFDPRKHKSLRECAIAEMREEAMLVGGEVVELLPEGHPGQSELKWSRNKFKPFLFIDPQPDPSGHAARDAEEHTIEVMRVTIPELYRLIHSGKMMLPSVYAAFLSLEVLKARKLI
eukprot:XP_001699285.1 predicted protein [Chlamydomonas reinhardtii]